MKVLPVKILKNKGEDFSNGGLSSKYDDAYLICDNGWLDVPEDDPKIIVLEKRILWGEKHWYCKPNKKTDKCCVGWMMGGCFIYSSDSRFPSNNPIPLHDRQETQEHYDMLSD